MPKLIKGTMIQLGTEDYQCPPLCLDDAQAMLPRVQEMQAGGKTMSPEGLALIKEVVHAALLRNYPDMKIETVGKGLDLGNAREIMDAVMARTGFAKAVPGQGEAGGAAVS